MQFGDPGELKGEKALALRTLTQPLAYVVCIVEHGGRRTLADAGAGCEDLSDKPEERRRLLAEVTDWFAHPCDGQCSLDLVCGRLGFNTEA